ncbi:gluconokinase [Aeromonas sp. R6-2]|uniref:gluconokinase n=1 Tax=unclassified Aeromonas TaxID=257493 RepID=UPI0034A34050
MAGMSIIVMGVSGSGKSSVGARVAEAIGAKFIDGDDLHPRANIQKMANGTPLNDADRAPWLERIRDAAYSLEHKNETGIIVCSALKRQYRDLIRDGNRSVRFLFLDGEFNLILERMKARQGHFMKEAMLQSQFTTLERPEGETGVIRIDIDGSFEQVVERAVHALEAKQ